MYRSLEPAAAVVASPLRCALLAGLLLALLAMGRWYSGGKTWSYFAVAGSDLVDPADLPFSMPVSSDRGYDGQFFLRLSLDPWPDGPRGYGILLDDPAYRQQRIGLPVLAWVLSMGRTGSAPFMLVGINLVALSLAVGVCGTLARELGRPPALGLLLLGIAGLVLAFGRDLAEPLVVFFLSLAALSLVRGSVGGAALALTGAVLTREDALLAVAALAVASALQRTKHGTAPAVALAVVLPLVSFLAWQTALWARWERIAVLASTDRLALPLGGLFDAWSVLWNQPVGESVTQLVYLLWHVLLAVEVGRSLSRADDGGGPRGLLMRWSKVGWLLWAGAALFFAGPVWGDEWAFARVLSQWSFFGFLLLLLRRWTPSRGLAALTLLLVIGSAGRLLLRP